MVKKVKEVEHVELTPYEQEWLLENKRISESMVS